jgi:hypothetical protein
MLEDLIGMTDSGYGTIMRRGARLMEGAPLLRSVISDVYVYPVQIRTGIYQTISYKTWKPDIKAWTEDRSED